MRRRDFIAGAGGAAVYSFATARAQQADRPRRIGVLMTLSESDPEARLRVNALENGLAKFGWVNNRTIRIEYRWAMGEAERQRTYAVELVQLKPDVLVGVALSSARALSQATTEIPIVFAQVVDPVGAGLVQSLARPGGNATGFTTFEYSLSGKWLELIREMVPDLTRVLFIMDPASPSGAGEFGATKTAAAGLGIDATIVGVSDADDIERAFTSFAGPNGAVIVLTGPILPPYRDVLIRAAARHRLPAIYPYRYFAESGGLASYGADTIGPLRQDVAAYVDRVLKGEKPAELPVQAASRLQLVLNLKTAKSMSIAIPPTLLARADEVIE